MNSKTEFTPHNGFLNPECPVPVSHRGKGRYQLLFKDGSTTSIKDHQPPADFWRWVWSRENPQMGDIVGFRLID